MSGEEPKPSVQATPDTFGLVVQSVFDTQRQLGELMHDVKTLTANLDRVHDDSQKLEIRMNSITRTMYAGWVLLVVMGSMASWTIFRVWDLILPLLQTKLGLPTK